MHNISNIQGRPTKQLGFVLTPYFLLALGLSLAANALLWHLRDNALKETATVEAQRVQAVAAAQQCSEGVAKLEAESKARSAAARKAVLAASERARQAEARAQGILSTAPSVPGDACLSAAALGRAQINARRAAKGDTP